MVPEYIKIFMSFWLVITSLFWTRALIDAVAKHKRNFNTSLFVTTCFWGISGLAPVWGIAMLWKNFS